MRKTLRCAVVAAVATVAVTLGAPAAPARALTFNFSFSGGTAQQQSAMIEAGNLWSSLLTDSITVEVNVGFSNLGSGVLGQASTALYLVNYSDVRTLMGTDASSADDTTAVNNLAAGSSVRTYLNRTAENGNSATPYVTTFSQLVISGANAKALGFGGVTGTDASITFSNQFAFDYDRTDGIASGAYDFVGIAAHELGHSLGFFSSADDIDAAPGGAQANYQPTTLDLFRYSTASIGAAGGKAIDITADNRQKFFSLNGSTPATGNATSSSFSNGVNFGDGRQASHWKDDQGIGIMDPTASIGEQLLISELDLRALDVIGYNRSSVVLPEPSTFVLMGLGGTLLGGVALRRRRRSK